MIRTLARVLERPLAIAPTAFEKRDAIVVLGAALRSGDRLTPVLRERVATAAMLFEAGAAPLIVVTGGLTTRVPRAEADVIADHLVAIGVPREQIVVENSSRTTRQNAENVAALHLPIHRIWLITQPFHAKRAEHLFAANGFDAKTWHIIDSLQYRDHRRAVRWLVREYAAWLKVLLMR